jgi:ParB-like chromosome segregation protein Spo0J
MRKGPRLTHRRVNGKIRLAELSAGQRPSDMVALAEQIAMLRREHPEVTVAEIGERLGRSGPWVSNLLRLLKLPAAGRELVRAGVLSVAHAKSIASLGEVDQLLLIDRVLGAEMSSHELERYLQARRHDRVA